jgi:hypothetical protein
MNSISFNTTSITWVTPRHDWAIGLKSGKGTGVGEIWRIIISAIIIMGTRGIYLSKTV